MKTNTLQCCPLFQNIENLDALLKQLHAHSVSFHKGQYILHSKQQCDDLGIVLEGSAQILKYDVDGNANIFSNLSSMDLFAEAYAGTNIPLMVDVIALEDTTVLFLQAKINNPSSKEQIQFLQNLLTISLKKNRNLSYKISHISLKTIRERLLAFLYDQSILQNSKEVQVYFNRQQLADYLCVDRSALSNEISKLKKEGILDTKKHSFYLK